MTILYYKNNPKLKAAGVQVQMTPTEQMEYIKCARDPIYFIKNYIKIVHVDRGVIPFDLWAFQIDIVNKLHANRYVICRMARQSGKTSTVGAYLLHQFLFNKNYRIAILANKGSLAREILDRLKKSYELLPYWMQQGIVTWNKGSIESETGSRIVAAATTSSGIRGETYNSILLDEFAHVEPNMAEEFFTSVYPVISSGKTTKMCIVSTPKGMNHFYKMWMAAEQGISKYVPIVVHWSEVPGRDEAWKKETIANTSEEQFSQEFDVSFLGSSHTLIGSKYISQMVPKVPLHYKDKLAIYEFPEKDHVYLITVDTSRGKGIDHSAFSVIDITEYPYRQVAVFRDNETSPSIYPDIIARVAINYNNAALLIENNDVGGQVADLLHYDLEYENIINPSTVDPEMGVKMTKAVKRIGCFAFKDLIENGKLLINDMNTIEEISTFVRKKDTFQAEEGAHDDIVMGLVLFGWLTSQSLFQNISDHSLRSKMIEENLKKIEEDMLPPFFMDDGIEINTFEDVEFFTKDDRERRFEYAG